MDYIFPNALNAPVSDPMAYGGDLSKECLMSAYSNGIFPWFLIEKMPVWFSPDPRCVLYPNDFRLHKSLKSYIKKYNVKFDKNTKEFINFCRQERLKKDQTWITKEFVNAYSSLVDDGIVHSVEVYENDILVGGLYGLIIGKMFCGESMVSSSKNASKVALYHLCKALNNFDFLIDCQVTNPHLIFMGAKEIPRSEYLQILSIKKTQKSGFDKFGNLI